MDTQYSSCPACGHQIAVPFFDAGEQALATIAWPASETEALAMKRLPLTFVQCVSCGHVYNRAFEYDLVPYTDKPNKMFNAGTIWNQHLGATQALVLQALPENPTVIEIGCGSGQFLRGLAGARKGRYIGFDPNAEIDSADGLIEARQELFVPGEHLASLKPDLIVMRHVLEHLKNPLAFLQDIVLHCKLENLHTLFFAEVPCIDRVFSSLRLADFYFEHHSHFTLLSFRRLLEVAGYDVRTLATGYDDEVTYALAQVSANGEQRRFAEGARDFHVSVPESQKTIGRQLAEFHAAGKRVAIWGGTGKGAAFIHHYGADKERFPLVVDSDRGKVGTFVPGAGQEIRFRDVLHEHKVDVVIIPTQWRAKDIVAEMRREKIEVPSILIEHGGQLVDFFNAPHPYKT